MKKCALCGKRFDNNEAEYGLSCLKRLCLTMNIDDVKQYNDEKKLNKKVCKVLGKGSLPDNQSKFLTNRYCTLKLLEEVELKEYDKYRNYVENDIHKIGINTSPDELKSFKKITLKQANVINKHYKKNKNIFQKINDGDYDAQQYITSGVIRFAFSMYYLKKPYLSDMIQKLQFFILKGGAKYQKDKGNEFSASCLEHALKKNPSNMEITKGKIISKIKKEPIFKATINNYIKENKDKLEFYKSEIISFNNGDLFNSLHNATLIVNGKKEQSKWRLTITITDLYDFTELIKIQDYVRENQKIEQSLPAALGNNIALIATSCNVVHSYNITIKFNMEV